MKSFYGGMFMCILGVVFGVYVGGWVCFIGGISDIIDQFFNAEVVSGVVVGWGLLKVVCASAIGGACAWVLILPGLGLIFHD